MQENENNPIEGTEENSIVVPSTEETRGDDSNVTTTPTIGKRPPKDFDKWLEEHGGNELNLNASTARIRVEVGKTYKLLSMKETDLSFATTKDEHGNEKPLKLQWTPMQFVCDNGALISTKHFANLTNTLPDMPQLGTTIRENMYFIWWCEVHNVIFKCLFSIPESRTYNGTTTTTTKFGFQPIQM